MPASEPTTTERFVQDPHVARVIDLCQQRILFDQEESLLARLRSELLQQSVAFFARCHPRFYATHFERLGITPENVTMMDLPRLAVTAEQLRGKGQRTFIVPGLPPGGATFQSSGTTSGSPVIIYRSRLDMFVQRCANGLFWEHMLGNDVTGGTCLFMASPELRSRMAFVEFVSEFMEQVGSQMIFGLKLEDVPNAKTVWERLKPDGAAIMQFYRSHRFPKFIFSAPVGIYGLINSMRHKGGAMPSMPWLMSGTPPIRLGHRGAIVTGGGSKGGEVPPLPELMQLAADYIRAEDAEGRDIPAPFMDVLGFTESLIIFPSRPFSLIKHPHPLTEVFVVDPKNPLRAVDNESEGLLGYWNPLCTSYFEAVYPGLVVKRVPGDGYHGRGFLVKRRMTPEEGWQLQRACGEVFGQAFRNS